MSAPVLEIRNIHTFIGQFHILEGVNVSVPQGSITVMLGRNGAGKTTTLKSVMGLTPPSQGAILFEGKPIHGKRPYHIAQLGIGYVPEHRAIFKTLTVRENLELAERQAHDLEKRIDFIFNLFPAMRQFYHYPAGNLSGGQQQMLAIARVLVPENRLLLIDEPSEGLAPVIIEELMAAIQKLAETSTVLLVEQNFRMASRLADRYVILDDGQSRVEGVMPELIKDEQLIQRYLGVA
ncbi:MAG: ABC transporter ATP-binding protein [Anaerolineae bacterium]|jgi:branched-chain amino acid transport system ATP-binding protein|nr:ABC transporter ATP-binding protein [Anaerolineae bacterium]